jgi:hypothetical protein
MKHLTIVAVLGATLITSATAQAGHPVRGEAKPRLIQAQRLEATATVQAWRSKPLTTKHLIYIHVYRNGREVKQASANGCGATYRQRGLQVRVRILGCAHRRFRVQVRYVSFGRHQQPVIVRITTSACDTLPGARGGCY